MMLNSWRVLPALIGIFVSLVATTALPGSQLDHLPEITNDDYPDTHDGYLITNGHNYIPNHLNLFSEDENNLFDKSHPHLENMEENKMAFELQKRTSRIVNEPKRRRLEFAENLPKNVFLANLESQHNRRYRRPFVRKSFSGGNLKFSFPPGKRPYYYSEPEGSEFLGGPGK